MMIVPLTAGRAEENARILALGQAGIALSGEGTGFSGNPANLAHVERWTLVTGFAGGADFESRPGLSRRDHPDSLWGNLSEAALLVPVRRGMGLAVFVNRRHLGSLFGVRYEQDVLTGLQTGGLGKEQRSLWMAGLAAGVKISGQSSVGLAGGLLVFDSVSTSLANFYLRNYPAPGFQTSYSRAVDQYRSGEAVFVSLGSQHNIRDNFSFGIGMSSVFSLIIKSDYHSATLWRIEVLPNFPFDGDNYSFDEQGESEIRSSMEFDLGIEFKPASTLRLLAEGDLVLGRSGEVLRWNERDDGVDFVLDKILWEFEEEMILRILLGAELELGKWALRLGLRDEPSSSPRVTDELKEQRQRVPLRWGSFGVGYKNPFISMDLGYAFGTGVGTAKQVVYEDGAGSQPGMIQRVRVIPIHRRELHIGVVTFSYVF